MILWAIATICAFFVKGVCGFANTLVFTTILSFGSVNINITPVELILGYPTNFILVLKERRSINWRECVPLSLLVILGSIPGALFLKNADSGIIKMFFGIVIVLVGIEMLFRNARSREIKQSKVVMGIIGIISGLLCGLYGIGALLGAYVSRVSDSSNSFKANICAVFLVDNTFRIVLYSLWGIINFEILKQAIILIPLMLIGLILGMFSVRFLNERIMKIIVIIMLIISGVALIVNNI